MTDQSTSSEEMIEAMGLTRRDVLTSIAAITAASALSRDAFAAEEPPSQEALAAAESPQFKEMFATLTGARTPMEARVKVEIPESNETGNIVPYKLAVESAMAGADLITSLRLLSTGNPQPLVATFHFTEFSGRAAVAGRMRLAKSQTVIALAETAGGELFVGKTFVGVAVGGCGNE